MKTQLCIGQLLIMLNYVQTGQKGATYAQLRINIF